MRLNEVAQHAWDVVVGLDPAATLDPEAAEVLLDLFAGPMGFLLGFSGKPDALAEPAIVELGGRGMVDRRRGAVESGTPVAPTATLTAAPEASSGCSAVGSARRTRLTASATRAT